MYHPVIDFSIIYGILYSMKGTVFALGIALLIAVFALGAILAPVFAQSEDVTEQERINELQAIIVQLLQLFYNIPS